MQQKLGPAFVTMTFNVRYKNDKDAGERTWGDRIANMIEPIERYRPEVIGIQELRTEVSADFFSRASAAVPGGYTRVAVNRGDGEMVALMWRTSRFAHVHAFSYNVTNAVRDGFCGLFDDEDSLNRPIIMAKLRDTLTGVETDFYNTHYPAAHGCERYGMTRIFDGFIFETRTDPSDPMVLMGDFNDGVEADGRLNGSYSRLLELTGTQNAYGLIRPWTRVRSSRPVTPGTRSAGSGA